jgi:hypothetical protein
MSYGIPRAARALSALAATSLAVLSGPASAALGGDVASVRADTVQIRGQLVSTEMTAYTQHDITTGPNTIVHEYISRAGKVFAVTWRGPLPPNLPQLFGDYFETYRSAAIAQSHPGNHRHVSIVQPDFVVQALGRLRAFQGTAYVPSLVPAGVNIADLP